MRHAGLSLLLIGTVLLAQTPASDKKTEAFFHQRKQLQAQAKSAFDREMAREKAGDCPNANTTLAMNECFGKAVETSTANYQVYVGALHAMLLQKNPYDETSHQAAGPTGQPVGQQDLANGFDRMQSAWEKYRDVMCSGAGDLYRGGTIVNSTVLNCELMMLRSHMRELAGVYGDYLSH